MNERNEPSATRRGSRTTVLESLALPGLTLGIIVFFSILPATAETFPTAANFRAIAGSQAIVALAALAVLIPLICEELDLSVGANAGLCAVMAASVMAAGGPLVLAALVGVGVGVVVGVINGLIVTRLRISAVIGTLGTSVIIVGLIQAKTDGKTIAEGISPTLVQLGSGQTAGIPNVLFAVAIVATALYFVLNHTPLGRHFYMLGSNRDAARLVGLPTNRLLFLTFVLAGLIAGIAGVLLVGVFGSASPRAGDTLILPALAAAFLSAASIHPGRYNVGGALIAIAFLAVLNGGLNLLGTPLYVTSLVNGIALILGVALASLIGRSRFVGRTVE